MLRNRVKEFRELHQLSQEQLAEKAGVTRQTVNYIETEQGYTPQSQSMVKLAMFFNCELGVLFYIDREAEREKVAS